MTINFNQTLCLYELMIDYEKVHGVRIERSHSEQKFSMLLEAIWLLSTMSREKQWSASRFTSSVYSICEKLKNTELTQRLLCQVERNTVQ